MVVHAIKTALEEEKHPSVRRALGEKGVGGIMGLWLSAHVISSATWYTLVVSPDACLACCCCAAEWCFLNLHVSVSLAAVCLQEIGTIRIPGSISLFYFLSNFPFNLSEYKWATTKGFSPKTEGSPNMGICLCIQITNHHWGKDSGYAVKLKLMTDRGCWGFHGSSWASSVFMSSWICKTFF